MNKLSTTIALCKTSMFWSNLKNHSVIFGSVDVKFGLFLKPVANHVPGFKGTSHHQGVQRDNSGRTDFDKTPVTGSG